MSPDTQGTPRHAGLAAAAYILVLLGASAGGAALLASNDGLRDQIEGRGQVLAAMARQAAAQTSNGSGAGHTRMQDAAAISAPTETVAASELQKRILARLGTAGGTVHSVQAEPVKDAANDGLHRLVAQLTFDASITALQRLLFDLETGVPFMFVDSLTAQPATASVPGTKAGDRLRVTLSVSSYWKQR